MQHTIFDTSGHAVFALHTHIVFVTKYRHKCITQEMLVLLKKQANQVCTKWRCKLIEFNGETDHLHLLVSSHPTVAIADLVANLKTTTSRVVRSQFAEQLRPFYWKPVFWSSSYAAFSVGAASLETVIDYIRNQESPSR